MLLCKELNVGIKPSQYIAVYVWLDGKATFQTFLHNFISEKDFKILQVFFF